jgi:predicted dehydrogenase
MVKNFTRRDFIKVTTSSLLVAGFPTIIPASARGRDGKAAPSERIVMGWIGTGGQGTSLLKRFIEQSDVQVIAVADVDARNRASAAGVINTKYGNKDCASYKDFRELLARKEIDAVTVATPDHWHALASIAAAEAGKDIYCEKPLANSVAEGRAICEAVKKHNCILQTGSHERSTPTVRQACELIRNGLIGKVKTVHINLPCDDKHHNSIKAITSLPLPQEVPAELDYDFWLGHTPKVPYYKERTHFWWRFILSYGGGEMTDRGAHVIDLAQLGLGTDATGPVEFDATGTDNKHGLYDSFMDYKFVNTYANGVRMIGSTQGPRGLKFEGTDGWIFIHIHGGKLEASDPALLTTKTETLKVQLGRSPGHYRNFLDSVRSRQLPLAHAELGHRTATICHLNNLAMKLGRKLKWDPKQEKVINDAEANRLLSPKMRGPWSLA